MQPPLIVSESDSISAPGPFYVFKTVRALEGYLEPWYVNEPHFIFDSDGMQLEISPDRYGVRLAAKVPRVFNPAIARMYFATFLRRIGEAKGWRFVGVAEDMIERGTLSELAEWSAKFADY